MSRGNDCYVSARGYVSEKTDVTLPSDWIDHTLPKLPPTSYGT